MGGGGRSKSVVGPVGLGVGFLLVLLVAIVHAVRSTLAHSARKGGGSRGSLTGLKKKKKKDGMGVDKVLKAMRRGQAGGAGGEEESKPIMSSATRRARDPTEALTNPTKALTTSSTDEAKTPNPTPTQVSSALSRREEGGVRGGGEGERDTCTTAAKRSQPWA